MHSTDQFSISIEHVGLRMGDVTILDDITASIPNGANVVIVGPNGAGKTSLLRCLLGDVAHSGLIRTAPGPLRTAYVPQQLHAERGLPLQVGEFVALGLQQRPLWLGIARDVQERIGHCLELVQAEKLVRRRLGALSGGELRRVLLAAALARQPQLLLLDEAEAGVDVQGEQLFWNILDKARKIHGFIQIMVSHNLPLAAHHATHVLCLNRQMLAFGPPHSTLSAATLFRMYGVPIHLYPEQCAAHGPACQQCGALCGMGNETGGAAHA